MLCVGCAGSNRDRAWVTRSLAEHGAGPLPGAASASSLQQRLADGLDETEVVALALALSPAYRAELTRIDAGRADLAEARTITNPQLSLMGAFGPVSAVATLLAPLESLWQLPRRSEAAARALEVTAESLVQRGLDLARDARLLHAQRGLSEARVRARSELSRAWEDLARLGAARARAGESPPAEADGLRAEAAMARDALEASQSELLGVRAQLRSVLGLEPGAMRFDLVFRRSPFPPPVVPELVRVARVARPDLRAAELALEAAYARAGYERSRVVAVAAQAEGHWTRPDTMAARLGARVELPIFGANPGGIGRANAEIARAEAQQVEVWQRVRLEIVQAQTRAAQAFASLETYRSKVLPPLQTALQAGTRSYELGEEGYVVVLDALRRIGDARLREAELLAEWRRADAEMERAIGARIGAAP
jgi:cobalt-zinc-cadmium efflux system outer membrane protein